MTSTIDTPKVENEYLKMNSDELKTTLVSLKEALSSEVAKDINAADLLGLPIVESKNTTIDAEEVEKLQSVIKFASEKLEAAGVKTTEPQVSKMSEIEKQLSEKQEKMARAKFSEQITELSKLDANLDVDLIKSLNMETEDKVTVASLVKTIATPYITAISKLSGELKSANEQAESLAKFKAPEPEDIDGAKLVASKMSEFGLTTEEKN